MGKNFFIFCIIHRKKQKIRTKKISKEDALMYVSAFNPHSAVAFNQGYQSGATATPVSFRSSLPGNSVTYSFNPMLAQQAFSNPMLAQSMAFNPMINPINWQSQLAMSGMHMNPLLSQAMAFSPSYLSGQALYSQIPLQTIQSSAGLTQMRVDLAETNSDIVLACELPNVSLNDLSLTVTDDSMSISATAWAGNRPTSLFRTIALPTSIRSEQVEATYSNGILEIRAPKSDIATRRKIKVNVAQ
jgi:HSP20 family protein